MRTKSCLDLDGEDYLAITYRGCDNVEGNLSDIAMPGDKITLITCDSYKMAIPRQATYRIDIDYTLRKL